MLSDTNLKRKKKKTLMTTKLKAFSQVLSLKTLIKKMRSQVSKANSSTKRNLTMVRWKIRFLKKIKEMTLHQDMEKMVG